jgi:membrane protein
MTATTRSDRANRAAKRRFYERYIDAAQHTGNRLWDAANKLTHGYISYLAQALKNFSAKGAGESVNFGYWAVFSLFPLVMLGIVIATFALGPEGARAQVYNSLGKFIPGGGTALIRDNIEEAIAQRGSFGIIGIIGLIYGSVGLFTNLQFALSRIFRDKKQRLWPIQIMIGVIMLFVLASLIIVSVIASTVFSVLGGELFGQQSPLLVLGAGLVPLVLDLSMFALLFRYVPRRNIAWRPIFVASLIGALIWELGKSLFGWYATNLANFGLMYGSLGTVIALLTWTYLTGCLISICAEIAVATDDWLAKRPPAVAVVIPCVNKPADQLKPIGDQKLAAEANKPADEVSPDNPAQVINVEDPTKKPGQP